MPRRDMTPEGYVKDAVLDLLAAERIFVLRVNSGDILLEGRNGKKRLVKLAPKGTADILAIVPCGDGSFIPLWLETKSSDGKLSIYQKLFRDDVTCRGHVYLVIKDVDQIREWLGNFRMMCQNAS